MRILLLVVVLWLCSCASKPIPISYHCPRIMLPPDPAMATAQLTLTSTPDQVAKAYWSSLVNMKGWDSIVRAEILASEGQPARGVRP